ncbi:MAG TPA: O-antigen ligase family protein [Patescibacteria group bacterium]|nr:O-antigen ligase family protein [Patescibacteria group bacterium]
MALLISIIFLILLPLGQWIRLDLNNGLSLVPLDLGIAALSVIFFLTNYRKITGKFYKPIMLFMAALFLSLFLNFGSLELKQFLISGAYLLRLGFYFAIYFLILNSKKVKQKLPSLMLISGTLLLIIGFIQYAFYPDLRNLYYLGWDEHLYRLFSSFLDPNFAGSFFVLFFVFLIGTLNKNKFKYLLSGLSVLAVFLTYSRSGYVMLITSTIVFFLLKGKYTFIIGFVLVFLITLVAISKLSHSSEGTNLLRLASTEARVDSAKNAIAIFKNSPIFGVGFDSYRYAQHRYGFLNKNWENVHSGAGTDNSFLFILATSGMVGFLAYIYLLLSILKNSLRSKDRYSIILFSSLVGLIINSLFVNSLFYPAILLWLMALLGLRENK